MRCPNGTRTRLFLAIRQGSDLPMRSDKLDSRPTVKVEPAMKTDPVSVPDKPGASKMVSGRYRCLLPHS